MAQRRRRDRVRSSAAIQASAEPGRSSGRSVIGATSTAAARAESPGRAARSTRASVARSALKSGGPPVSASNATAASEYRSVRAHDVGVLEPGAERRLAPEPLAPHRARGDLRRQHLHGDDVTQRAMAGPEHGAHAAGARETHHLVAVAHGALHVFECGGRHAGENVAALAGDRIVADNRDAMADSPSPHLSVRVLGPARVTVDGAAAPPELLWRKHLALLVYLARSPRKSRTREHLVGLLWSDRDEKQARHSLSEALRVLRP